MASDEQNAVDQLDALLAEGVLNESQVNDLENVVATCCKGSGEWRKNTGEACFTSALRAAVNDYKESA